jgi:DNA repair photolyase
MTTWNLFTGCNFFCSYCWARKLAEGKLKRFYPNGFIPTTHPDRFRKCFKLNGFVFPVSMGDIAFAPFVVLENIIECAKNSPNTKFLLCSKDPERYRQLAYIPDNVYLGTTIETTENFAVSYAPTPSERYTAMLKLYHQKMFVSIEPIMDFDLAKLVWWMENIKPEIVEVGVDNYHNNLPEPEPRKVRQLLYHLKQICPVVVEKKGLERLKERQK